MSPNEDAPQASAAPYGAVGKLTATTITQGLDESARYERTQRRLRGLFEGTPLFRVVIGDQVGAVKQWMEIARAAVLEFGADEAADVLLEHTSFGERENRPPPRETDGCFLQAAEFCEWAEEIGRRRRPWVEQAVRHIALTHAFGTRVGRARRRK